MEKVITPFFLSLDGHFWPYETYHGILRAIVVIHGIFKVMHGLFMAFCGPLMAKYCFDWTFMYKAGSKVACLRSCYTMNFNGRPESLQICKFIQEK